MLTPPYLARQSVGVESLDRPVGAAASQDRSLVHLQNRSLAGVVPAEDTPMPKSVADSSHRMGKMSRVEEKKSSWRLKMCMYEIIHAYLSSHPSYPYLKDGLRSVARSFPGDHGEPFTPMIGDRGLSMSGSGQIGGVAAGIARHDHGMMSVDCNRWLQFPFWNRLWFKLRVSPCVGRRLGISPRPEIMSTVGIEVHVFESQ